MVYTEGKNNLKFIILIHPYVAALASPESCVGRKLNRPTTYSSKVSATLRRDGQFVKRIENPLRLFEPHAGTIAVKTGTTYRGVPPEATGFPRVLRVRNIRAITLPARHQIKQSPNHTFCVRIKKLRQIAMMIFVAKQRVVLGQ